MSGAVVGEGSGPSATLPLGFMSLGQILEASFGDRKRRTEYVSTPANLIVSGTSGTIRTGPVKVERRVRYFTHLSLVACMSGTRHVEVERSVRRHPSAGGGLDDNRVQIQCISGDANLSYRRSTRAGIAEGRLKRTTADIPGKRNIV